jgi:hypothetical protein
MLNFLAGGGTALQGVPEPASAVLMAISGLALLVMGPRRPGRSGLAREIPSWSHDLAITPCHEKT